MGNNKGRSQGCKTCVRRRVKCDQARPICMRCAIGNFNCLGYRDAFVDGRVKVFQKMTRGGLFFARQDLPQSVLEPQAIYPALSASAWKRDIVASHLMQYLGLIKEDCANSLRDKSGDQEASLEIVAQRQSFLAVATTFYGLINNEETFVHEGMHLYGQALQIVTKIIGRSRVKSEIDGALKAVTALCFHEAIAPLPAEKIHPWVHHVFGLEYLFALRGPLTEADDTYQADILECNRYSMIAVALYLCRPSLLARPEWSAARRFPTGTDYFDGFIRYPDTLLPHLLDDLAQLSVLYAERRTFIPGTTRDRKPFDPVPPHKVSLASPLLGQARSLIKRAFDLLRDARSRRFQWKATHPESEYPSPPLLSIPSSQPYPYPEVTHFSSLGFANAAIVYHNVVLMLNEFIVSMYKILPNEEVNELAKAEASRGISVAVMEILKTLDYHYKFFLPTAPTETFAPRNKYIFWPIWMACLALSQSKEEEDVSRKLWLKDFFSALRARAENWPSNSRHFVLEQTAKNLDIYDIFNESSSQEEQ